MSSKSISTTSDTKARLLVSIDQDGGIQVLDEEVLDLISGGQTVTAPVTANGPGAALSGLQCINVFCEAAIAQANSTLSAVTTVTT